MIDNEQNAWNGNNDLNEMQRRAYDIENMGNNTAAALAAQSDQMKRINNGITSLGEETNQANAVINNLLRRENRNKLVFILCLVLTVFVFLFLIVYKFLDDDDLEFDMD